MIIGFDFDKVFINYPPLIPYSIIDFFYKGASALKKEGSKQKLQYRFPGPFEQKVRIATHYPILRHPIKENINALRLIKKKGYTTYLVSSRFGFLRKRTDVVLNKYKLNKYFNEVHFNFTNKQPHIFKEETIKKLKIDTYIDDDLDLALYLSKKMPNLTIYWISDTKDEIKLPANITKIATLKELLKILTK